LNHILSFESNGLGVDTMSQQIVRISSLAKTLDTFENTADSILHSGFVERTPEEIEAFKLGFQAALNFVRKEYGIPIAQ
jgi:hypothetical protein